MPQPLESRIDGHQRSDALHTIVSASATGVNLAGNLIEVVTYAGELFTVAAFQQTAVLIFSHPHREHFAAFIYQSGLLITPERTGNLFPVGAVLDKPQARQWFLAGFGAQP